MKIHIQKAIFPDQELRSVLTGSKKDKEVKEKKFSKNLLKTSSKKREILIETFLQSLVNAQAGEHKKTAARLCQKFLNASKEKGIKFSQKLQGVIQKADQACQWYVTRKEKPTNKKDHDSGHGSKMGEKWVTEDDQEPVNFLMQTRKDPVSALIKDVVLEIFSHLNLATLGKICLVSKEWKRKASDPILLKMVVYKELALGNDKWAQWFGKEVVKDEDRDEEFSSLPLNIVEEYKKFQKAFPEKKAKDSLILVRLPKTLNGELTINSLGELAKRYFPNNENGYGYTDSKVVNRLGNQSIDKSRWVLMTKDLLPESRDTSYAEQKDMIANLAQKSLIGYEVPGTLEAVACIFAQHFSSQTSLFSDSKAAFTRCKENVQGYQVIVGGYAALFGRIYVYDDINYVQPYRVGVCALRKF